jgi:hypothetical protein
MSSSRMHHYHHVTALISIIFAVVMLATINCDATLVKIAHHDNVIVEKAADAKCEHRSLH